MFNFFDKSDAQIQKDVLSEMKWDQSLAPSNMTVTAKDGVVTLRGNVPHYFEKTIAEKAAQRVGGVRAIANEIEVQILGPNEKKDEDIAAAAANALQWNYQVPDTLKISVDKGRVTLRGEVQWDYQRTAAINSINRLAGVHSVNDLTTIKSKAQTVDIKNRIEEALKRSAESEGRKINVSVNGDKVTLTGNVHSFSERDVARLAAWNAPGIMHVDNQLKLMQ